MNTLRLTLNPLEKKSHINPEIYGNFSEHLGRCIYDGIYVGENSDIPNTEGFRTDVVDAFRQIKLPVLRWPGGCFADESLDGRYRTESIQKENDQYTLGRRCRGQQLRNP